MEKDTVTLKALLKLLPSEITSDNFDLCESQRRGDSERPFVRDNLRRDDDFACRKCKVLVYFSCGTVKSRRLAPCHSGAADRRDLVRAGETWHIERPCLPLRLQHRNLESIEIIPVPVKRSFGEGLKRAPPRGSVRLPFSS